MKTVTIFVEAGSMNGRALFTRSIRGMAAGSVIYRVYEITFDDGFIGRVAMSALREISFRQEITEGKRTGIVDMRLIAETEDRNVARELAGGWEI